MVARVAAGDRAAFAALTKQHLPALFRFADALSGHSPAAEDAVQEAFMALWNELTSGREVVSLKAWLRVVARHALVRQLRSGARETLERDAETLEDLACGAGWGAADAALSARKLEDRDLVRVAFAGLDVSDREVLWLVDVDGLSVEEAAAAVGASLAATKSRLHRARLRFMRGVRSAEEAT